MPSSFSYASAFQADWATRRGLRLSRPGYVARVEDNLLSGSLSPETEAEFASADGGELNDSGRNPAKMRALISSSALAVNFFGGWRDEEKAELGTALGLQSDISMLTFEHRCSRYPVGPGAPNLDVMLTLADGSRVGIESKFLEPFRTPGVDSAMSLKYYPSGEGLWERMGLRRAQQMVARMRGEWDYLDAPQLLKHILGLRSEFAPDSVHLIYLWYDTALPDAVQHRAEVARFREAVTEDGVRFDAKSYQELFRPLLRASPDGAGNWADYLVDRYFRPSDVAPTAASS